MFGAPEALVSYFECFGGQPDGKEHSIVAEKVMDPSLTGTIQGGFKLQYIIRGTVFASS